MLGWSVRNGILGCSHDSRSFVAHYCCLAFPRTPKAPQFPGIEGLKLAISPINCGVGVLLSIIVGSTLASGFRVFDSTKDGKCSSTTPEGHL